MQNLIRCTICVIPETHETIFFDRGFYHKYIKRGYKPASRWVHASQVHPWELDRGKEIQRLNKAGNV